MGAMFEMKKFPLILWAVVLLCFPAYAVRQERPHTYQKKTAVYQKRQKTYTRNTIPKTTDYQESEKNQTQKDGGKPAAFPVPNKYALPNANAYATVSRNQPAVDVKVERKEVDYVLKDGAFSCDSEKATADGCTRYKTKWSASVDCAKPSVALTAKEVLVEIDLNKQHPKGSCLFDLTLKHELTHLSLNRKTLDTVLKTAASEILTAFQAMQRQGNSCEEIKRSVFELSRHYADIFIKEQEKQNNLIDGDGHYKYQNEQCAGKD